MRPDSAKKIKGTLVRTISNEHDYRSRRNQFVYMYNLRIPSDQFDK